MLIALKPPWSDISLGHIEVYGRILYDTIAGHAYSALTADLPKDEARSEI